MHASLTTGWCIAWQNCITPSEGRSTKLYCVKTGCVSKCQQRRFFLLPPPHCAHLEGVFFFLRLGGLAPGVGGGVVVVWGLSSPVPLAEGSWEGGVDHGLDEDQAHTHVM